MVFDAMRGYVQLANGLTDVTKQRASQVAKQMVEQGGDLVGQAVSAAGTGEVARQIHAVAEDLLMTSRTNRDLLVGLIRSEVDRAVRRLGLVNADQMAAMAHVVERLQNQLDAAVAFGGARIPGRASGGSAAKRPPDRTAAAPTSAAKTSATKATAKKATAKKTTAKKSATKKTATKKTATKKTAAKKTAAPSSPTVAPAETPTTAPSEVGARTVPAPATPPPSGPTAPPQASASPSLPTGEATGPETIEGPRPPTEQARVTPWSPTPSATAPAAPGEPGDLA
jgi:hypothetical protein